MANKMDKSNIVNTFTTYVEQLRNKECSQKEKLCCFQHIAECIMSPALTSNLNYATHCSTAINVLLLFCEDLDSVVRMSAEENLNKIFRVLEKTRVSRILMDLYGEIKRNGNQRSLRICLNLFAHYAPQVREKHVKWYAIRLLTCMQTISHRKETLLCETLCEFVKCFGKYLQIGLTDSETCKLFDVFLTNIGVECAVKRRCSAQNCISLIENSRNKSLMAKHGLNKVIELLLTDQRAQVVLGALVFLRLLLPLIIRGFRDDCNDDDDDDFKAPTMARKRTSTARYDVDVDDDDGMSMMAIDCKQIIEIYDYCLHLLSTSNANANHSIINAALEVISAILLALDHKSNNNNNNYNNNNDNDDSLMAKKLLEVLSNQHNLQHNEMLQKRKSLRNQIFQLKNYDETTTTTFIEARSDSEILLSQQQQQQELQIHAKFSETKVEQFSEKSKKIIIAHNVSGEQEEQIAITAATSSSSTSSGAAAGFAYAKKLDMQNISNEQTSVAVESSNVCEGNMRKKKLQQQQQQQYIVKSGDVAPSCFAGDKIFSTTITTAGTHSAVGISVTSGNDDNDHYNDVEDNNHDVHQEVPHQSADKILQQQAIRNSARSISECVEEDGMVGSGVTGCMISDEDDDDFTTLSEINEAQDNFALTTKIDVDNLIDAMDAATTNEQAKYQNSSLDVTSRTFTTSSFAGDEKSQFLSDMDNDSFNSIDFEAEITIGGMSTTKTSKNKFNKHNATSTSTASMAASGAANIESKPAGSDTIGAFFNNLISHSNAASESVSKLFRQTSASALKTAAKTTATSTEQADELSTITTASAADSISFISSCSSGKKHTEIDGPTDEETPSESASASASASATATASTALIADDYENNGKNTVAECSSDDEEILCRTEKMQDKPKTNPFLNVNSPLKKTICAAPLLTYKIGSIFEQSLLRYTARIITALFLLPDQVHDFLKDVSVRVSIKSLSLIVLAQCVRLSPVVLEISLEIGENELQVLQSDGTAGKHNKSQYTPAKCSPGGSSNSSVSIGNDYEHVNTVDCMRRPINYNSNYIKTFPKAVNEPLLLDIKDDHFGKGTCDHLLNTPSLSRSADPLLFTQQQPSTYHKMDTILSKSDIISSPTGREREANENSTLNVTQALEDVPPIMLPPQPPKRSKSLHKSAYIKKEQLRAEGAATCNFSTNNHCQRQLVEVLLYYSHIDPVMRGGVQQLIGNYVHASNGGSERCKVLNMPYLLALLINGLQDEIHTVVIQALNAFEKIFPHVVSKYLKIPLFLHHYQHQENIESKQTLNASQSNIPNKNKITKKITEQEEEDKDEDEEDNLNTLDFKNFGMYANKKQLSPFQYYRTNDVIETDIAAAATPIASSTFATTMITTAKRTSKETTSIEKQQVRELFTDNDELIAELLTALQLQLNTNNNNSKIHMQRNVIASGTSIASSATTGSISKKYSRLNACNDYGLFTCHISPKLLLNKLRLCYYNKYWLIQNKYAEVISNLNYAATLRSYYNNIDENSGQNILQTNENIWRTCDADIDHVADVDNLISAYDAQFLDELFQLLGDDDFRVREQAAICICRFIISHAKQHLAYGNLNDAEKESGFSSSTSSTSTATPATSATTKSGKRTSTPLAMSYIMEKTTCQTNFNLLWDFFDYHIFTGMSLPLRNLFRPRGVPFIGMGNNDDSNSNNNNNNNNANIGIGMCEDIDNAFTSVERRRLEEEKVLAKVLYQMTNKLMDLNEQNMQFGIIRALKVMLQHFNMVDYQLAWSEFNFLEICLKYSHYNYNTAIDLNCQRDLIEVMSQLIAGGFVSVCNEEVEKQKLLQQQLNQILAHTMKFISMYYYVFSNQKPLFFAKVQKSDLFSNARELAVVQSMGYFGNDYVYIKLYNILRSANDSYKISISTEAENVFIALLKTCLNTLNVCVELSSSLAMAANKTTGTPGHSTAAAVAAIVATTAINFNASSSSIGGNTRGGGGNGSVGVFPSSAALKLIEEVLHYLSKLINYASSECITCLRQLLKYLFARNYGSRRLQQQQQQPPQQQQEEEEEEEFYKHYDRLTCCYLTARSCQHHDASNPKGVVINRRTAMSEQTINISIKNSHILSGFTDTATATATGGIGIGVGSEGGFGSTTAARESSVEHYRLLGKLFIGASNVETWKSEFENDCAKHIKLFEPLVVFCMTLFMKSNARVQAPILELLSQLLEHNVTYSILDSKNVIFDQIINNIDLIEEGVARNAHIIIPPMIKFLMQLTHKSDRKLITIPKIISLANNLLANNAIRESALLALKSLAYEIFFMPTYSMQPAGATTAAENTITTAQGSLVENDAALAENNSRELDTQREVVLGMLEKFIDAVACQRVLGLLLLRERCAQQMLDDDNDDDDGATGASSQGKMTTISSTLSMLQQTTSVVGFVCHALCATNGAGRLKVCNWSGYLLLDAFFRNNSKNLLADSKEFLALLRLFINARVTNFSDLSYATIILANVISKTEEIYLVNHIKLYLKNNPLAVQVLCANDITNDCRVNHWLLEGPSTSSAALALRSNSAAAHMPTISEINYFAKVLCAKLCDCLNVLMSQAAGPHQHAVIVRFVSGLQEVCCQSPHKDALQSVFRQVLAESNFLDQYYNFLLICSRKPTPSGQLLLDEDSREVQQRLQIEIFKLLSSMNLLDGLVLLQQIQTVGIKWSVQRTLLHEVCLLKKSTMDWNLQQVRQLFGLNVRVLEFLITEQFAFLLNLCAADDEFCSLLQIALLEHTSALKQDTIRPLLHLIWRLCNAIQNLKSSIQCVVRFLQIIGELHRLNATDKMLQMPLQRLLSKIISTISEQNRNIIYECLKHTSDTNKTQSAKYTLALCQKYIFNGLNKNKLPENTTTTATTTGIANKMGNFTQLDSRIIDEKWLYAQLVKFSSQANYDAHQLAKILLEIQSENKLHKMFNTPNFDVHERVLRHAISSSLQAMLASFRNNCIQHNPHIHYLQPNPLARVACTVLMTRIEGSLGRETLPLMGEVVSNNVLDAAGDNVDTAASVAFECGFKIVPNIDAINKGSANTDAGDAENALVAVCANLSEAVSALLKCLKEIESTALIYIEARLIKRFICENFLRATELRLLLRFIDYCCQRAHWVLTHRPRHGHYGSICSILHVLDLLLQQELIWKTLNQGDNILPHEKGQLILSRILDLIVLCLRQTLENTNFYRQLKLMLPTFVADTFLTDHQRQEKSYASKAIFVAKLIEALSEHMEIQLPKDFKCLEVETASLPLNLIISIGISVLRTNQFYAYAVTPFEIMQQQLREETIMAASRTGSKESSPVKGKEITSAGKMPTIPLENLSDVDVLRNFVKRLSIFGFTTRQQFEEYFMTFLLLINKVYDENMVDQQEQFQIKSTCFEAILELLITYKTFPIVGNKLSQFHHTTRWSRINCENISLKKLHKVQLLIPSSIVFYHGNLERQLAFDTVIGTKTFYYNQYDLNFIWQQMEAYAAQPSPTSQTGDSDNTSDMLSGGGASGDNNEWRYSSKSITDIGSAGKAAAIEDIAMRNYRYFTTMSGVDFKSSSQLIFDVLMQMIEHNHIMALPNLVKFCEICESRDQIKWIKDKAFKLQEAIPMDDTISHQHLIYLVCKTQAMLIPTLSELQQLCTLIGTYLKSSHVFIRNATLSGVLSLLECCYKTNTTIGKLSDELALLRDLIVGYINRHGIIDESSMNYSDTHLKLVWTLNFCLIEWTSKFVPQCHLLSNAIISASNFLRKTSNEDVYLCVLHGLERIIVIECANSRINKNNNNKNNSGSNSAHLVTKGNIVTPALRNKIEKIALDLVKAENELFSIPALKLLLSCMYMDSTIQLEITELSNGIVQDDPEIIAQQIDKVDILLHCIKSSTRDAAWIYGQVLCQIIRDLVPPNEILTKVIKEFLTINQPHRDVIAMIVYQVFRSAIDSSFLPMLQDWLICSLPTFLSLPVQKGVWSLSVIFISASINLHLIKLFPVVLSSSSSNSGGNTKSNNNSKSDSDSSGGEGIREYQKLGRHDIALFVTAAEDFHAKLSSEQKIRFRDAFKKFQKHPVYAKMLQNL